MLNQAVIVGRLVREPELRKTESGKKVTNITVAVPRSYKNQEGEYDTDFIHCTLWEGVAEKTIAYVKKGDLLGVRGRIQSRTLKLDEDYQRDVVEVIAEKVTFLSSKRTKENENNQIES
ncbi:MAG: single-stranded DNA-binding protein [Firmicutes bacterium]|nr:single-stranded DNA-binding protein [Bacillota bacterium]